MVGHDRQTADPPVVHLGTVVEQLPALLGSSSPKSEIVSALSNKIDEEEATESSHNQPVLANLREQIGTLGMKQKILLETYLDQDIDRQTFVAKRSQITSQKKTLEESLRLIERNQHVWVKPMRKWLESVDSIRKVVKSGDLLAQKSMLAEIYGSNLFLKDKSLQVFSDENPHSSLKNIYVSLRETDQKMTATRSNSEKIYCLVGEKGLEPSRLAAHAPKACVSTNSTTRPLPVFYPSGR